MVFGQEKQLPYNLLLKDEDPEYNFDDYVRLKRRDFRHAKKKKKCRQIATAMAVMPLYCITFFSEGKIYRLSLVWLQKYRQYRYFQKIIIGWPIIPFRYQR